MRKLFVWAVLLTVVAIVAGPATAGSKGRGPSRYHGSLVASPDQLHAGDSFDVWGCGYETEYGNVLLGFGGGGWGSPLDGNGCFSIQGIPVGGDDPTPGTYPVTAFQWLHNKWTATGQTTVTILPS